jgi:hypothetical protein
MSPDEMRAKSAQKVKQVMELMKVLHLRVDARQRVSPDGFIEGTVFWIDEEKYPQSEKQAAPAAEEKSEPDHA